VSDKQNQRSEDCSRSRPRSFLVLFLLAPFLSLFFFPPLQHGRADGISRASPREMQLSKGFRGIRDTANARGSTRRFSRSFLSIARSRVGFPRVRVSQARQIALRGLSASSLARSLLFVACMHIDLRKFRSDNNFTTRSLTKRRRCRKLRSELTASLISRVSVSRGAATRGKSTLMGRIR